MARLLEAETLIAPALRAQYAVAVVARREADENGFRTHFRVPESTPRVVPSSLEVCDNGYLATGASVGFELSVQDGALATLEGYTHSGPWPENAVIGGWEESVD